MASAAGAASEHGSMSGQNFSNPTLIGSLGNLRPGTGSVKSIKSSGSRDISLKHSAPPQAIHAKGEGILDGGGAGTRETACSRRQATQETSSKEIEAINRVAFRGGLCRGGNVHDHFTWNEQEDKIGRGSFGRVFRGRSKHNCRQHVAVKQIARSWTEEVDKLWSEITILSELDHPNVLHFFEAFESAKHIYVITELCLGGSLSEWLPELSGRIQSAVRIIREVTGALAHCHAHKICHRDLKPDNILLLRDALDSPVRLADFGLAKRWSPWVQTKRLLWAKSRHGAPLDQEGDHACGLGDHRSPSTTKNTQQRSTQEHLQLKRNLVRLTSFVGTPEFMAPEVVRVLNEQVNGSNRKSEGISSPDSTFYDFRCDVWSPGVIAYTLLSGTPPFSVEEVSAFVVEELALPAMSFELPDGKPVPSQAQAFVQQCLCTDFMSRPTTAELLGCPWFSSSGHVGITPDLAPPSPTSADKLAHRLEGFANLSHVKRAAKIAAVRHLGAFEREELRAVFQRIDVTNDGAITIEELRKALAASPSSTTRPHGWIDEIAHKLDSDLSGKIDFTEFLAAAMDARLEDRQDLAMAAFRAFDIDGDGFIQKSELAHILDSLCSASAAFDLGDSNSDSGLSFDDFLGLLRQG